MSTSERFAPALPGPCAPPSVGIDRANLPDAEEPRVGTVEVGILGPLEVTVEGRSVDVGTLKQRVVLAALALEANRVISVDRLVEILWGEHPPAAAVGGLHAYVSNLRRALEPDRRRGEPSRLIVTQSPGYMLRIDPGDLDAARFEAAAADGRRLLDAGNPAAAKERLGKALSAWRGIALADLRSEPFPQGFVVRLEELRLAAIEDHLQAGLELGANATAAAELACLVAEYPLRERMWELLMVALYRSGRQADALRAYQSARQRLADELGVEPGPTLRRLELDVLVHAPSLQSQPFHRQPPNAATVAGTVRPNRGGVEVALTTAAKRSRCPRRRTKRP